MREETARASFQCCDDLHISLRQLKVEDGQVFQHPLFPHGLRERDDAALNQPSQHDLPYCLAVMLRNRHQLLVLEQVVSSFGEGSPCLWLNAELVHETDAFGLLMEGIDLDLVDGWLHVVEHRNVHEAIRLKITQADCAQLASTLRLLHRSPRAVNIRERLMDQEQIEVVQA